MVPAHMLFVVVLSAVFMTLKAKHEKHKIKLLKNSFPSAFVLVYGLLIFSLTLADQMQVMGTVYEMLNSDVKLPFVNWALDGLKWYYEMFRLPDYFMR